uniref:Fibroleukin n=1 Tax=Magallana gigas TaxID=29159 RepID=K1PEQ9_MAGGI
MLHYVDSQVGARAKLQCMSYVEFPGDPSRAVCTERGKWTLNAKIQCKVPKDCTELYEKHNVRESGPHYISPDNRTVVRAFCKMTTEGGWTVVQNRKNASVNFTRSWTEYKAGFGEVTGNYWIGNDALHYLTSCNNTLRIQLSGKKAEYSNFRVSNESAKFMMTYDSFITSSNNAVDALGGTIVDQYRAKGMSFSTIDRDNDRYPNGSCADQLRGGWWYNSCSTSNLNGEYCPDAKNISCMTWTKNADNLHGHEETVIMIRRIITDTDRNNHPMLTQQAVHMVP